jgi:hypothetical protein
MANGHGGYRPGAGRKPGSVKHRPQILPPEGLPEASPEVADRVLAVADEDALWRELLPTKDKRLKFKVLAYLRDRRDGKPFTPYQPTRRKPTPEQEAKHQELLEVTGKLLPQPPPRQPEPPQEPTAEPLVPRSW